MAEKYYSILTNRGKELEAQSSATGKPVIIKDFVVGDGNGQAVKPDPAQTKLVREVYRNAISALQVSPDQANQFIAQLVLPVDVGGFVVREVGLLTDAGELYSVANCAAIEKPQNGVSVSLQYRLAVSETANIELKVATGDGLFLRQDANLSDVKDASLSRKSLGLKGAAVLDVGKAANTVAAGDDTRIVNALQKNSNLSDLEDKAKARENLELKTAAQKDVVTSKTDATADRVLTTGWMSLGGYGTDNLITAADALKPLRNGFYAVQSDPNYGNSALISFGYDSGSQVHIIAKQGGQAPLLGVCGSNPQGAFGNWGKIYTEFQKPTALDVGAVPYRGALGTDDLNTITGTKYGRFSQPLSANVTTARHYPIAGEAGALDVHQTNANGAEGCVQEYRTFNSRRIFLRTYNPTGSVWTDWCEFYTTATKPTASDVGALPITGGNISGGLTVKETFRVGDSKKLDIFSSNTSSLGGAINLWGNVDRPTVLEFKDGTGYHFYSQRNVNGSVSFSFNGAANFVGGITSSGEIISRAANGLRIAYGNFGTFWRNDGSNLYLMLTNSGDPLGNYNSLRPFMVNLTNGDVTIGKLALSNYAYFDERYQAKGSYTPAGQAYTKAESEARYNLKNTSSKSANSMYNKDSSTGVIDIAMSNITVANNTDVNVTFPIAFPTACVSVVISYDGAGRGSDADSSYAVKSYTRTGCVIRAYNANGKFMLIAKGY
ncbi:phage tail protein [Enterobacter ludwigii]|uniref:phage tail-collar fiber domain-containing protein n=1 Tax=Enterobacter ludwigii TaxID=299767 RepID=UPI00069DD3EF|nr:phage tail protein [Enterobacter ludwigii]